MKVKTTPAKQYKLNGSARLLIVVLVVIALIPMLLVYGITSYFRLSSDTAALRDAVLNSAPGAYKKQVAVNVGWYTVSAVKFVSRFFQLPPEARMGMASVDGGDVAVYELRDASALPGDRSGIIRKADVAMRKRGWERVVGVSQREDLVAVYFPANEQLEKKVKCCVVVMHRDGLVVASGRAKIEPLIELARTHMPTNDDSFFAGFPQPPAFR